MVGVLIVDGAGAALAGALALIGGVGDEEERDSENGKDGEENERKHQVLPGPSPIVACVAAPAASSAQPASLFFHIRCRLAGCSRLKA